MVADQGSSEAIAITNLLQHFSQFGIQLGLDSTRTLLAHLGNPHQQVPVVHVAGTNGKGSVCAYLSSILAEAGYRVGRYTSPHLVDWTERICINGEAIAPPTLLSILQHIETLVSDRHLATTQFELITAAAWLYFAQQHVDIAVMEVGLGGRLDTTNVCDRPLVSVITSISRDHWQQLGPTLAHIATEKAGILKPQCPAVIGPLPPEAEMAIAQRLHQLNCPAYWVQPASLISANTLRYHSPNSKFKIQNSKFKIQHLDLAYTIPLIGEHQRTNSALAIATSQLLQSQGWAISTDQIRTGLAQTTWAGRLQWMQWNDLKILVDGAHNQAAAAALRCYVDELPQPIHWIIGMLETKDHEAIFGELLRRGDRLSLVPVPEAASAPLAELAELAQNCCPSLQDCQTHPNILPLLDQLAAPHHPGASFNQTSANQGSPMGTIVLCGSLYLIGHVFSALPAPPD